MTIEEKFSVKAVAKLSGVSAHTLRAWERRYSVVEPDRTESGRRVYSMEDVEKLRLLNRLIGQGHSIGNLASMSGGQLKKLNHSAQESPPPELDCSPFLSALRSFELDELDRLVLKARINTPLREFVLEVVSPLFAEVGALVAKGTLNIAQEHAFSAILRSHLGEMLSQVQKTSRWGQPEAEKLPRLVFSTREGDRHEFGILLAAILAGQRGFSFRYLGCNLPADVFGQTAEAVGAKILVVGSVPISAEQKAPSVKTYIKQLSGSLKSDASIWVGGFCDFDPAKQGFDRKVLHLSTLKQFDHALLRLTELS